MRGDRRSLLARLVDAVRRDRAAALVLLPIAFAAVVVSLAVGFDPGASVGLVIFAIALAVVAGLP